MTEPEETPPADAEEEQPDSVRETHPSYVMVGFYRTEGGRKKLFGSALPYVNTTIRLEIKRAERKHSLNADWFYGKEHLISVELSPAQFAQLLTTMNAGSGVPGTLRWLAPGGEVPDVPDTHVAEHEKIRNGFEGKTRDFVKKLRKRAQEVDALLDKPSLNKADRGLIRSILDSAVTEVASNMPFAVESFQEAAEKLAVAAKAEVDAFLSLIVTRAGLRTLLERSGEQPPEPPQLPQDSTKP